MQERLEVEVHFDEAIHFFECPSHSFDGLFDLFDIVRVVLGPVNQGVEDIRHNTPDLGLHFEQT